MDLTAPIMHARRSGAKVGGQRSQARFRSAMGRIDGQSVIAQRAGYDVTTASGSVIPHDDFVLANALRAVVSARFRKSANISSIMLRTAAGARSGVPAS